MSRGARHAESRCLAGSTDSARQPIRCDHGSGTQPVCARRRPAAARAGRPRPGASAVRRRARAGGPRAAGAQPGPHRAARRRQDRAAQRAAQRRRSSDCGAPERSRPVPTSRCVGRWPARCTWRYARSPRGTAIPSGSTQFLGRAQGVRAEDQLPTAVGSATDGTGHRRAGGVWPRRHRRHRGRPGRAVRRRGGARAGRRQSASRCSSTRCRTSRRPTCRRCARPVTSCPSRGCRSSSWAPGCRTCRPCCRRRSRTSERLFRYVRIDRLDRSAADLALVAPGQGGGGRSTSRRRWTRSTRLTDGYPYFVQAYGKVAWDHAPVSPDHGRAMSSVAAPEAEAELAVGFFGSRYERATPAEREYLRAMAALSAATATARCRPRTSRHAPRPQAVVVVARRVTP